MSEYPDSAFTVASTDNLDYLHRVYCGKQQSSWHGTTVQVVQPQPVHLNDSVTPTVSQNTHSCIRSTAELPCLSKRLYSTISPTKSPSKSAPSRKRQCTQ